jgi:hypothetical protein
MSSRTLNRKQFLVFSASAVATSALAACSDDPVSPGGASGSGGTAGSGTSGSGTSGSASGSTSGGTAGSGTSGSGGSSAGKGGSGGSGGSAAGSGGSGGSGGGGGAGGGGGSGGGGGTGGGGGGMCGSVTMITHTSTDVQHTHIPADQTMLKMDLKTFINMAVADTTEFTVPMGGQGDHVHKFKLTAQQITMLKGGGMVTGIKTATDTTGHIHEYTIVCMA